MKRERLIFRLESSVGTGIYRVRDAFEMFPMIDGQTSMAVHPMPSSDKELGPVWNSLGPEGQDYIFGFKNITQLLNWFDITTLRRIVMLPGPTVYLSVYRGIVYHGDKQSMILRESAQHWITFPLETIIQKYAYSKKKIHVNFMDRLWSLDRKDFVPWLKSQLEKYNAGAAEDDLFSFDLDGWKELRQTPGRWNAQMKPEGMYIRAIKELIETFAP